MNIYVLIRQHNGSDEGGCSEPKISRVTIC